MRRQSFQCETVGIFHFEELNKGSDIPAYNR